MTSVNSVSICVVAQPILKPVAVVENASVGKPATQGGTVLEDRIADNAVDGNTSRADPSMCASAFYYGSLSRRISGWWQVDLEDFYLVKAVTVYIPTVQLGRYVNIYA